MARFGEGSELIKAAGRSGATMIPMLCSAWSAEDLSGHLARKEDSRRVDAETFSFGFSMGLQPLNAGALFESDTTGLLQRFLFAQAGRPEKPEKEIEPDGWKKQPKSPGPLQLRDLNYGDNSEITICDEAAEDIWVDSDRNVSPGPYDVQRRALWIKTAGVLAVLHASTHVDAQKWDMAKRIVAMSSVVRQGVAGALEAERMEKQRQRAEARANEAVIAHQRLTEHRYERFGQDVERVAKYISQQDQGVTLGKIYTKLWNSKTTDRKERALAALQTLTEDERIHMKGKRYHLGKS